MELREEDPNPGLRQEGVDFDSSFEMLWCKRVERKEVAAGGGGGVTFFAFVF